MSDAIFVLSDIHRAFVSGGRRVRAVRGVSLTLQFGQTLGIVGESGSGKSTLGRIAVGLERADSGEVTVFGTALSGLSKAEQRRHLACCQMVFQDPYSSLNPRLTVGRQIGEALRARGRFGGAEARALIADLFARVGLKPEQIDRYPHEFSGGQRQRIAIARALAPRPKIVVADEPVSALDVTIQAQILDLMAEIQGAEGLSYLFISHDIAVVAHMCDRIAVMHHGRVVEFGETSEIIEDARHPYTRNLLEAVPRIGRRRTGTHGGPRSFPEPSAGEAFAMITPSHGVLVAGG